MCAIVTWIQQAFYRYHKASEFINPQMCLLTLMAHAREDYSRHFACLPTCESLLDLLLCASAVLLFC